MIAVCLLTCDRFDYTARTLASFAAHNDLSRFVLLHGDDASTDPRIVPLAQSYGFRTVVQTTIRSGWLAARRRLIRYATKRAEWILLLENDILWLRAFPWALFEHVRTDARVVCLRLYGRFKDAEGLQACLPYHKRTRERVDWQPLAGAPEPAEIGAIHWSAQPAVTRHLELWAHHATGDDLTGLTVRVVDNVTSHIGLRRTPAEAVSC